MKILLHIAHDGHGVMGCFYSFITIGDISNIKFDNVISEKEIKSLDQINCLVDNIFDYTSGEKNHISMNTFKEKYFGEIEKIV